MDTEQNSEDRTKIPLNRVLQLPAAILLVAGIMIGSGVFKKIAPMSQTGLNEHQILMAWVIAGIITLFGAFTYAGLAGVTTRTGGVYEYLRLVYGDFVGYLFGWSIFMIGGSGAIAALAFVFAQSVDTLVHFPDPFHGLAGISIANTIFPFAASGIKIFAVLTICALTWINYRGVTKGSTLNSVVTWAKILGIVLLILIGLFYNAPAQLAALPGSEPASLHGRALFGAMFAAMLSALWAYDGWANITYITGEIKNPQKNIPIAIVCGLAIAMGLYVLLNYSFMHVLSLHQLSAIGENKIAAAQVAGAALGKPGTVLIAILIMISTFGALNGCIIVYPRVYYRMAQEKVFFRNAAKVHPVFRTPYIALAISLVWSCWLTVTGTFDLLTNLIVFSGYLFFALAALGVILLKRKGVIKARVTGYPVVPVIIILFSLVLVTNTIIYQTRQSLIGLGLVFSGLPFYYFFKRKYQRETK